MMRIDVEQVYRSHPFVKEILERLQAAGFEAVLIGGVVRDGVRTQLEPGYPFPPEDIDIATSASPEEIERLFRDVKVVDVGRPYGVMRVVAPDGRTYEVASYRVEGAYRGGRWPEAVELVGDLESDVKRRDLTINGLAAQRDGEVVDYVGGIRDLKKKIIDTIGDPEARFAEDYLRILRAVRCACELDGKIHPRVETAIQTHAARIREISNERIRDELFKILRTTNAAKGIRWLDEYGLLEEILPELVVTRGTPQPKHYHPEGDVFNHLVLTLEVADRHGITDPILKLAVLLHDVGKPIALEQNRGRNVAGHARIGAEIVARIGRRLRLTNDQIGELRYLVQNHMRIADLPKMRRAKQVRFMQEGENPEADPPMFEARFPRFAKLLELMIDDFEASARQDEWRSVVAEAEAVAEHIAQLDHSRDPGTLINGRDLLEMGVPEGPRVGEILGKVHEQILAGEIRTRDAALTAAERLIEPGSNTENDAQGGDRNNGL